MAGITQTVVAGQESTQTVPSQRAVRDVADRILYLDPDAAPLTVVLGRSGSAVADNWKFEWLEKELPARWDAINNGAGYNATATSVVVDNGKFFSAGDILNVVRTGEKIRVVSIATNTLTVVRAVDGDNINGIAILDNDDLQIIGNAYAEGDVSGTPKSVAENWQFNYTQIIRTPCGTTRTEANTRNYGGPDRTRLRLEKAIEHKIDLERTALYGSRNIDTSSLPNPRRYTGGLLYFLNTAALGATAKIKDFGGLVTEAEIEDWMQDVFNATGAGMSRTMLASPTWCTLIDQLAGGRLETVPGADTYGVTVRQYVSVHGTMNLVKHRLLENSPVPAGVTGGPFGYAGAALALDFSQLKYRFLANSNTQLHPDIQANDYDGWKDEYLSEFGWQIGLAKVHGYAKNATG